MKLKTIVFYNSLLLFSFLSIGNATLYANGYSFNRGVFIPKDNIQKQIILNNKNQNLKTVFSKIERQCELHFVYNSEFVDVSKIVNISVSGDIHQVLKELSIQSDYRYLVSNNQIIVGVNPRQKDKIIKGRVIDTEGKPVRTATISLPNQAILGRTNEEGYFEVVLPKGTTEIEIRHLGYQTLIQRDLENWSVNDVLEIILQSSDEQLEEVVVTALGIKKDSRKLGYALQELKPKDISQVPTNNFASQLSGKIAGLTINNSPNLMQETNVLLRGSKPLIVIDGIPVNSNTYDIDSDDIENISVLKGATGAALYGSKGQNGVIQITTKKGSEGTSVAFSQKSIFRAGWIVFPETQNEYGNGEQGKYAFFDGKGNGLFDNDFIWGPKMDQKDPSTTSGYWETTQWDSPRDGNGNLIPTPFVSRGKNNLENFLENGYTLSNNVNISRITDKTNLRLGLGYDYTNGEIPSTGLKNYNASFNASTEISERFKLNTTFQYNYQNSPNFPRTTYGNTNILYGMLIWAGKDVDMRDFKDYWQEGKENYKQKYFNYSWINNPYYMAYEQTQSMRRNKVFAVTSAEYKISKDWNINVRQSAEVINGTNEMKYPKDFIGANAIEGNYELKNDNWNEYNSDLFIKYNKEFGKFGIDGFVGGSINFRESTWQESMTQGLQVPRIYNLSNSVGPVIAKNNLTQYARNSAFVSIDLSYDNSYYLSLSERIDQSSALPKTNNTYTYPSVSGSIILSNVLGLPNSQFLKARGSWAQVRADLAPYQYQTYFNQGIIYNGMNSVTYSPILGNAFLRPQKTDGFEVGLAGAFFNNKVTFDLAAYRYIDSESIFDQESSLASGFTKYKINGNRFNRNGLELVLGYNGKLAKDLQWNSTINWSTNRVVLDRIDVDSDNLSGIKVGDRMDSYLTNSSMQKTADGQLIIGTNGLPVRDNTLKNLGHINPDWTIGWSNGFTYRENWSLSFVFEARVGGVDQANLSRQMWYSGAHPESVGPEREAYNLGEKYIAEGVNITETGIQKNTYSTTYKDFVEQYWYRLNGESNLYDLSFVKVRELSFGYSLPKSTLDRIGGFAKSASFSLIGSNLFLISDFPFSDPDIGNGGLVGNQLQFPSTRNIGFNLSFTF